MSGIIVLPLLSLLTGMRWPYVGNSSALQISFFLCFFQLPLSLENLKPFGVIFLFNFNDKML